MGMGLGLCCCGDTQQPASSSSVPMTTGCLGIAIPTVLTLTAWWRRVETFPGIAGCSSVDIYYPVTLPVYYSGAVDGACFWGGCIRRPFDEYRGVTINGLGQFCSSTVCEDYADIFASCGYLLQYGVSITAYSTPDGSGFYGSIGWCGRQISGGFTGGFGSCVCKATRELLLAQPGCSACNSLSEASCRTAFSIATCAASSLSDGTAPILSLSPFLAVDNTGPLPVSLSL